MADDWIKMRINLWTHPKVVTLASQLSVTRAHTIGALHCAWGIADQHAGENGTVEMSAAALDSLCETPGLAAAMVGIGWLVVNGNSMQFVNYQEHNGETGKQRADNQRRQRLSRKRVTSVTEKCDRTVTRGEERREEKRRKKDSATTKEVVIPEGLNTPEFVAIWEEWLRVKSGTKLKPESQIVQLKRLAAIGPIRARECIESSIANGYQGLFPEKFNGHRSCKPTLAEEFREGITEFLSRGE